MKHEIISVYLPLHLIAEKPMSKEEEAQQQPAVENGAAAVVLPPAAAAGLPPYSSVLLQPVEQGQGFTSVAVSSS